jgi:rubrerythrin
MDELSLFLAHAIRLETEAARNYEDMAEAMKSIGNHEARGFFRKMAEFARMHLADAQQRAGFNHVTALPADAYQWPDGTSPEAADWTGVDAFTDEMSAMLIALESERRAYAYYKMIAVTTQDPSVRTLAVEFVSEEAEHVVALEARIAAAQKS